MVNVEQGESGVASIRKPKIFLYSMLLPVIWYSLGSAVYAVNPGANIGIFGTAVMFVGTALLICWLFVRRHRRAFSNVEYRKIIAYCLVWAICMEALSLTTLFTETPQDQRLPDGWMVYIVLFTLFMDTLFVWLSFRNFGLKLQNAYVSKHSENENLELAKD